MRVARPAPRARRRICAAQFSAVPAIVQPQCVSSSADHSVVFELALAEPQPVAQAADDVRRLAHALHAAGEDDVRLAELNHLRAADRRLDARPAQPIDRQRRHFDRHARP